MHYPQLLCFFHLEDLLNVICGPMCLYANIHLFIHSVLCSFFLCDLPRPTQLGAAIDSACMMWQSQRGHCWVYDMDKYRFNLHIVTAGARAAGLLCVSVVCYRVLRHGIHNEDEEDVKARLRREAAKSNACARECKEMIRRNDYIH